MTRKEKELRNSKIIQYRIFEKHTVTQTASKFGLSINQIFIILKRCLTSKRP